MKSKWLKKLGIGVEKTKGIKTKNPAPIYSFEEEIEKIMVWQFRANGIMNTNYVYEEGGIYYIEEVRSFANMNSVITVRTISKTEYNKYLRKV